MSLTVWGPELITMCWIDAFSPTAALLKPELGFLKVCMPSRLTLSLPIIKLNELSSDQTP